MTRECHIIDKSGGNAATYRDDEQNDRVEADSPEERAGKPAHAYPATKRSRPAHLSSNDGANGAPHDEEAKDVASPSWEAPATKDLIKPVVSHALERFFLIGDDDHVEAMVLGFVADSVNGMGERAHDMSP